VVTVIASARVGVGRVSVGSSVRVTVAFFVSKQHAAT